jgi:hypothetical protein
MRTTRSRSKLKDDPSRGSREGRRHGVHQVSGNVCKWEGEGEERGKEQIPLLLSCTLSPTLWSVELELELQLHHLHAEAEEKKENESEAEKEMQMIYHRKP